MLRILLMTQLTDVLMYVLRRLIIMDMKKFVNLPVRMDGTGIIQQDYAFNNVPSNH